MWPSIPCIPYTPCNHCDMPNALFQPSLQTEQLLISTQLMYHMPIHSCTPSIHLFHELRAPSELIYAAYHALLLHLFEPGSI